MKPEDNTRTTPIRRNSEKKKSQFRNTNIILNRYLILTYFVIPSGSVFLRVIQFRHDITEILLKVALNTINQAKSFLIQYSIHLTSF